MRRKIKEWPFVSFQALKCHYGAVFVQGEQLQNRHIQTGQ